VVDTIKIAYRDSQSLAGLENLGLRTPTLALKTYIIRLWGQNQTLAPTLGLTV